MKSTLPCILTLATLAACSDNEPLRARPEPRARPMASQPSDKSMAAPSAASQFPTPKPAPALTPEQQAASNAERALKAPAAQPAAKGELQMTAQTGWVVEKPASAMRRAQFRLPSQTTGVADGEMIAFFFPGQGGSVDANIERWAKEWSVAGGADPLSAMKRVTRTINGLAVHHVDLSGEWSGGMNAAGGKRTDYRLMAAIVETPGGPWFLKLVGPQATLDHWEPSWRAFVTDLKLAP